MKFSCHFCQILLLQPKPTFAQATISFGNDGLQIYFGVFNMNIQANS